MATTRHYRPGSFYRIDARTGFAERAERTRKEWTGQLVRERSWEPRQPQDFVRGRVDDQTVPQPRPRLPMMFAASGVSNLTADAGPYDGIGQFAIGISEISDEYLIEVASVLGWMANDVVWIMQDNGDYWRAELQYPIGVGKARVGLTPIAGRGELVGALTSTTVPIVPPMVRHAAAGNQVVNISAQQRIVMASAYPGEIGNFAIGIDGIGVASLDEFGQAPEGFQNESHDAR